MAVRLVGPLMLLQLLAPETTLAASISHMLSRRQDDDDDDDDGVPVPSAIPTPTSPASTAPVPTSASAESTSTPTQYARPGLDDGAKGGIAIGVLLGVCAILGLLYMWFRRRRRRRLHSREMGRQRDVKISNLPAHQVGQTVQAKETLMPSPNSEAAQVAYHDGGHEELPRYAPSPLSSSTTDRRWSEMDTNRSWSEMDAERSWSEMDAERSWSEIAAGQAHISDGFQQPRYGDLEVPGAAEHRATRRPVLDATVFEAPDTSVERPGEGGGWRTAEAPDTSIDRRADFGRPSRE